MCTISSCIHRESLCNHIGEATQRLLVCAFVNDESSWNCIDSPEFQLHNKVDDELILYPTEYTLVSAALDMNDLLNDDSLVVGDTGATTDHFRSRGGMKNFRAATLRDSTITASGIAVVKRIWDIVGMKVDKDDKHERKLGLKDVTQCDVTRFNLFSITKRMLDWLKLGGNEDYLYFLILINVVVCTDRELWFDIKVKTPKEILFYMRSETSRSS